MCHSVCIGLTRPVGTSFRSVCYISKSFSRHFIAGSPSACQRVVWLLAWHAAIAHVTYHDTQLVDRVYTDGLQWLNENCDRATAPGPARDVMPYTPDSLNTLVLSVDCVDRALIWPFPLPAGWQLPQVSTSEMGIEPKLPNPNCITLTLTGTNKLRFNYHLWAYSMALFN